MEIALTSSALTGERFLSDWSFASVGDCDCFNDEEKVIRQAERGIDR